MPKLHGYALQFRPVFVAVVSRLVRLSLGKAIALKPTDEAGRRGGDSIARRLNFIFKK
jgi:hypothetical protein